jgi:hypothetical protein
LENLSKALDHKKQEGNKNMEDYKLNTYADGFGIWHCQITYLIALGNTGEAEAIISNSMRAAKRAIRAAIVERCNTKRIRRLSYKVAANDTASDNRLRSLTIAEA